VEFDELLARLDLSTKIRLLTGADLWSLPALPEISLERLVMSDGPIGVRGERWSTQDPSVALPSPTALAATWDLDLVRRAGRLLAQEARRKGVHVLLAPTLNLHRTPLGGRHFECFSEDPLLTGEVAAAYVEGVQEGGVAATPKHFVANDSETERFTVDVRVAERVLREMYLAPFERVVRAGAWGVMSAYNAVNGTTMTEHAELVCGVLKREWGFDGFVVSDWTAVRSTEAAALGGTDVAMPGPGGPWGAKLEAAVRAGRVPEAVVDDRVRRILRLALRTGALSTGPRSAGLQKPGSQGADSGKTGAREGLAEETVDGVAFAREAAARSFTLLENDGVLPLTGVRTVALIGAAAARARVMGGGSAQVFPERVVSPLDGLRARDGVEVRYALGTDPRVRLEPLAGPATLVFLDADGEPLKREALPGTEARRLGGLPERSAEADLRTVYTPDVSGEHVFSVAGAGAYTMTVAGRVVLDEVITVSDPATAFLSPPERRAAVPLEAGVPVEVAVRHPAGSGMVAFTLGHTGPSRPEEELIAEAARTAAACDVAVVVVATTPEVESEGFDRDTLTLPGRQDDLVEAVAAANPRTVVVVNTGSPVEMPWAQRAAAVLLTWFPGQEAGSALADVLFGDAEPGGRLPTTWPVRLADCPVVDTLPVEGALPYEEGVFIGYRGWERSALAPAYWFGHGLGYTSWRYDAIEAGPSAVTVSVTNSGTRRGREVVQVYLAPQVPDGRPARWLAGFDVVEAGPGESVVTTVFLPERAFQTWTEAGWRTVTGTYAVEVGRSCADRPLSASVVR
jgi:beta-glucosidase